MSEVLKKYRVLKINGLTKKVLLEIDKELKLFKKYDLALFDENIQENTYVHMYRNVDNKEEFIFITQKSEKEE